MAGGDEMTNPVSAYKETRIRTASPGQLVLMLYAEAIRQCDMACELMGSSSKPAPSLIERINAAFVRAQAIVTELMASLDFEASPDISRNLFALYTFFNRELTEANITKDSARVKSVRSMLEELRSAWIEVVKKVGDSGVESRSGVNISG
jgi:flagellar secretion chaperone FliS